ncbi:PHP domain-containing protein [Promicromonospora sp. Populi]|uniref:PHP domain-containing protein n=1 Tax=Promicromonospora sp. Populi TaxID=3239420 RepID=UPI0034E23663
MPAPFRATDLPDWADPSVPASSLDPQGASRRTFLRLGMVGGLALAAGVPAAAAAASGSGGGDPQLAWLVGDHHVHSRYSHDAKYNFDQLARKGARFGLDWMVFTEHSNFGHADKGAAAEHAEIIAARSRNPRQLIFQGLEWYIPAAEHGTVFAAPGPHEVELLREFERLWDGKLNGWAADLPENEARAVEALRWLAARKGERYVDDVVVLANHPSRLGIDSPGEIRAWRDAAAGICIGMEGAPGAQGDADPAWVAYRGSTRAQRGEYVNAPRPDSFPGYPVEAYRTFGGFDWVTATVGGLWDAMLAEGTLFSITSNSDNHRTIWDTWRDGDMPPGETFDSLGWKPSPVDTGTPQPGSDFWPGEFSRTHVGVTRHGYLDVLAGLRRGRVWVDHGHLVDGLDVRVARAGRSRATGATLGGRLVVERGTSVDLTVRVRSAHRPNPHGVLPRLAHLDVIRGAVTGPSADPDTWRAPETRVVEQVDTSRRRGTYDLRIPLGRITESCYVRLRGSDGNRHGAGYLGASIDPAGPQMHEDNNGDPWADTWLYTNPVYIDVR